MRGTHKNLVVTTAVDEATGTTVPLFALPVQICKASESRDVRLDTAAPDGSPVEQVYRSKLTGELVERADLIKGVRTGDSFAHIPEESLTAIDEALKSDEIVVERTVDLDSVPFDRVTDTAYLQVPAKGGSAKSYRLLYEALQATAKPKRPARALRVTFTNRTRQQVGVIYADTDREALVMVSIRFAAAVRQPDEQILSHTLVEVDKTLVGKTRAVLDGLDTEDRGDWDTPVDETIERRQALVDLAVAGDTIEVPEGLAPVDIATDNIEAMLEASLSV